VQIAAALDIGPEAFLTNDVKLKQVQEIKGVVVMNFL